MSSTDIAVRRSTPLGTRARPSLLVSIGEIVGTGDKSHPSKLDHFRAKPGPYLAKFNEVFGEKPTELRVSIPDSDFGRVLDIRWKAWGSSGKGKPGYLKAIGRTNFAEAALTGSPEAFDGPEDLDGWQEDGSRVEVKITGPGDPIVDSFRMKRYTVFRFWLPEVLGLGAWAEISSTSAVSAANLFQTLRGMYRATQGQWVGMPLILYLMPATARPIVNGKRMPSSFWALQVRSPLSITEFIAERRRLAELQTGQPLRQLPPVDHEDYERDEELSGLHADPEARLRRVAGELPPAPDEPVRTREEPASFPAPDDATLNRIAALRAEVGEDAADTLLVGAFGVDTVEQLDAELAAEYIAGLERIAPAETVEGEVVADEQETLLPDDDPPFGGPDD